MSCGPRRCDFIKGGNTSALETITASFAMAGGFQVSRHYTYGFVVIAPVQIFAVVPLGSLYRKRSMVVMQAAQVTFRFYTEIRLTLFRFHLAADLMFCRREMNLSIDTTRNWDISLSQKHPS